MEHIILFILLLLIFVSTGSASSSSSSTLGVNAVDYSSYQNIATWQSLSLQSDSILPPEACDTSFFSLSDGSARLALYGGGDDTQAQYVIPGLYYFHTNSNNPDQLPYWEAVESAQIAEEIPAPRLGTAVAVAVYTDPTTHIKYSRLIVFAGYVKDPEDPTSNIYADDMWIFDTKTSNWTKILGQSGDGISNPGPFGRAWITFTRLGSTDTYAMFGGLGAENGILYSPLDRDADDLWTFNSTSLEWTEITGQSECVGNITVCRDAASLSSLDASLLEALTNITRDVQIAQRPTEVQASIDSFQSTLHRLETDISLYWNSTAQGVDDDSTCSTSCEIYNRLGTWPIGLEGSRTVYFSNSIYTFGGFSCTTAGVFEGSGTGCYHNTLYVYNFTTQAWLQLDQPTPDNVTGLYASDQDEQQANLWPAWRAYHTANTHNHKMWIFGGAYVDNTNVRSFYNDLAVFNMVTLLWETALIKGTPPVPRWSHSSAMIGADLYIAMGCTDIKYMNDVTVLKINQYVTAENITASGAGLTAAIAGQLTTFNLSTLDPTGALIPYGIGAADSFDVSIVNTDSNLLSNSAVDSNTLLSSLLSHATISEIGGGIYTASYTLQYGQSFRIVITFNGQSVAGSPFSLTAQPNTVIDLSKTMAQGQGISTTVKEEMAQFELITRDIYYNPLRSSGLQANPVILVISSDSNSFIYVPATVVDKGNGEYTVSYAVPDIPQYNLYVWLASNSSFSTAQLIGQAVQASEIKSAADASLEQVSGSPFAISTLDPIKYSVPLQYAIIALTCISLALLLAGMILVQKHRATSIIKSSSPIFLQFMLLAGSLILSANFSLIQTTSAACLSLPFLLGVGFTLLLSSLSVKNYRIMAIFRSKNLKVQVISNLRLGCVVVVVCGLEIAFDLIWSIKSPLKNQNMRYDDFRTYSTCGGENATEFLIVALATKGLMLSYGVFVAVSTRNVPSQFNEAIYIAYSLYNLLFTVLAVIPIIAFSAGNINVSLAVESFAVIWITLFTLCAMIAPKLYYVYRPNGDDIRSTLGTKYGVKRMQHSKDPATSALSHNESQHDGEIVAGPGFPKINSFMTGPNGHNSNARATGSFNANAKSPQNPLSPRTEPIESDVLMLNPALATAKHYASHTLGRQKSSQKASIDAVYGNVVSPLGSARSAQSRPQSPSNQISPIGSTNL
jgi:hypothetical protein